jgi:hypothetical protein
VAFFTRLRSGKHTIFKPFWEIIPSMI